MSNVDHPSLALNPSAPRPVELEALRALVETARRHADLLSLNAEHLIGVAAELVRLAGRDAPRSAASVCDEFARRHALLVRRANFGLVQALRALDDRLAGRHAGVVLPESFAVEGV